MDIGVLLYFIVYNRAFLYQKSGKMGWAFINKTRCWYGFWLIL